MRTAQDFEPNTVLLAAVVRVEERTKLRQLAAARSTPIKELISEALRGLFDKYDRMPRRKAVR